MSKKKIFLNVFLMRNNTGMYMLSKLIILYLFFKNLLGNQIYWISVLNIAYL